MEKTANKALEYRDVGAVDECEVLHLHVPAGSH